MALVAPPTAFDERRISRKLTINIDQHEVNVRPIIKGMYLYNVYLIYAMDRMTHFLLLLLLL